MKTIYDCIELIQDASMKDGVKCIVDKHYDIMKELPASISGQNHNGETAEEHSIEVCKFIKLMITEFALSDDNSDLLYSSGVLHDIGNCTISCKGEKKGWKFYKKTSWSRKSGNLYKLHPTLSAMVIGEDSFKNSSMVQALCMVHMEHWHKDTCLTPDMFNGKIRMLSILLCFADYLASREEVTIK